MIDCTLEPFVGKIFFFGLSSDPTVWVAISWLAPFDCPQGNQAWSLPYGPMMQPVPPWLAPACWWQTRASGLLLYWQLQLGMYSVGLVFFFFFLSYVALWDFKTPHRPACERVSYCVETSPSRLPPQHGSPSLNLLSLFLSFIFCPTSFRGEWAAFLGAWCPLPAFRSCFVEIIQHSNDLLMNLWERKWSSCPISSPSWGHLAH